MKIFKYLGTMLGICSITMLLISAHYIDLAFNMDYLDINGFGIIRTKQQVHRDGLNGLVVGVILNIISLSFLLLPMSDKQWSN